MLNDLKTMLRIPLYEIKLHYKNNAEMRELDPEGNTNLGLCSIQRKISYASIYINYEDDQNIKNNEWVLSLVHELYHVAMDEFAFQTLVILDFCKDDDMRKRLNDTTTVVEERMIETLAKSFFNIIDKDVFLAKYRKDDKNVEAENSK
jgi:hypothetical protein